MTKKKEKKVKEQKNIAEEAEKLKASIEEKEEQKSEIREKTSPEEPLTEEGYKKQIEELNDKFLRLYSEFDNYRKRSLKERIELSKTASSDVILSLLPVLDDFERALQAIESVEEKDTLQEGIKLIYNKLKTILNQKGLEEIHALGENFDTDLHEAITNIPTDSEKMKGKVVDVTEKGYKLNGKVIRFAKVVVGA